MVPAEVARSRRGGSPEAERGEHCPPGVATDSAGMCHVGTAVEERTMLRALRQQGGGRVGECGLQQGPSTHAYAEVPVLYQGPLPDGRGSVPCPRGREYAGRRHIA